jgi:putative transposase
MKYPIHWPEFFTATILEWKHLIKEDDHKEIIIESLHFLASEKRIALFAFVIMRNHIHLIWQALNEHTPESIQHSLLSYTAKKFKLAIELNYPKSLAQFKVSAKDRKYQFWERNALGIELYNHRTFIQKLDYIHQNPVKARICKIPSAYHYSSARFYEDGYDHFGMLTHYAC